MFFDIDEPLDGVCFLEDAIGFLEKVVSACMSPKLRMVNKTRWHAAIEASHIVCGQEMFEFVLQNPKGQSLLEKSDIGNRVKIGDLHLYWTAMIPRNTFLFVCRNTPLPTDIIVAVGPSSTFLHQQQKEPSCPAV